MQHTRLIQRPTEDHDEHTLAQVLVIVQTAFAVFVMQSDPILAQLLIVIVLGLVLYVIQDWVEQDRSHPPRERSYY